MSANDNMQTIDPNGQTANVVVRHDEPEPDITSTGATLVRALVVLSAFIFIAWAAMANLYKVTIAREVVARAGVQDFAPAARARSQAATHATTSGTLELADGTKQHFVPVAQGAALLLANPGSIAGQPGAAVVDGAPAAAIPALPDYAVVLDPSAAPVVEEAPAATEAPAQDAPEAVDAPDAAAEEHTE